MGHDAPENILEHRDVIRGIAIAQRPGIVLDFDGTLSEIVPVPDEAVIYPASYDALRRLVELYPLVSVLSGRGVHDLASKVGLDGVVYGGNHGSEYIFNGEHRVAKGAVSSRTVITSAVEHLRGTVDVPGLVFENKGYSASAHFRQTPDPSIAREKLATAADEIPGRRGLETFWGNMLLEIRPVRAINKGDAIRSLAAEHSLDAVVFAGDDTTDIDGMRALPSLDDVRTVGIAIVNPDTPPALIEAADYSLGSVSEVSTLLELLADYRTAWTDDFRSP